MLAAVLFVAAARPVAARAADDGADADPYGKILADYRQRMRTANVERAVDALQLLDPQNSRSLPEIVKLLATGHWYVRGHAIDALATVPAGPLRSEMRLHLITHEDPWVREGIAYAMSTGPVAGDAEALAAAMDDADFRVRRTASRALGEILSKEGVQRLVRAIAEEQDVRVVVWVRRSLRMIAGSDLGADPAVWQEWWKRHKDRPEWTSQGDEVSRGDFAGVPLETFTVESNVTSEDAERRRNRPDLFVLAPFGYSHDYFRPYLDEASRFVRITYVTLPSVRELTRSTGFGSSIPVYPVAKLAKALDALREQKEKDQIILMAPGPAVWIAEYYALKHEKHVAGLVLSNGWLDRTSYANGLMRLARDGTGPEKWAAGLLMGRGTPRRDELEGQRMRRIFLTHALTDRRDSEAWRLWKDTARDHGFVTVPPIDFSRRVRIEKPTLFTFPGASPLGGGTPEDLRRIRESFKKPPPITAVLRDSRGLLHVEEPQEFLRVLEGFLRYMGLIPR